MIDKLQEVCAVVLAVLVIATVCGLAVLQALGFAKSAPPEYLLLIATGIASYFFGARSGATKLNGNVSKLADAAAQLASNFQPATAPPPSAGPAGGQ